MELTHPSSQCSYQGTACLEGQLPQPGTCSLALLPLQQQSQPQKQWQQWQQWHRPLTSLPPPTWSSAALCSNSLPTQSALHQGCS